MKSPDLASLLTEMRRSYWYSVWHSESSWSRIFHWSIYSWKRQFEET